MRKPRDFDSELKALSDKARVLKERRVRQLGELVIACGADGLSPEQFAGLLLASVKADGPTKEEWRRSGAVFFQRTTRSAGSRPSNDDGNAASNESGTTPA